MFAALLSALLPLLAAAPAPPLALPAPDAAGWAELENPTRDERGVAAWLLALDSYRRPGGEPQEPFCRQLFFDLEETTATLPAGRALAALYSPRRGIYFALSRPFEVVPGRAVRVRPEPPPEGSADFLLILERPRPAQRLVDHEPLLLLRHPAGQRRPDLVVPTASRVYAVWYGLPPGPHRLVTSSRRYYLADRMVELGSGEVGHLVAPLAERRELKLRVDLHDSLRQVPELSLEMHPLAPPARLRPLPLERAFEESAIPQVPPLDADFVLRASPWAFPGHLDLSRGKDGELRFDPDATELYGVLKLGGDPARGKLTFLLPDQQGVTTATDENGRYQVDLWRSGTYEISAEVEGRKPYRFFYEVPAARQDLLDIDVPAKKYLLRVVSGVTGKPVQARTATYVFRDLEGRALAGEVKFASSSPQLLPPFGDGWLDLRVTAEGYLEGERKQIALSPEGKNSELIVGLEPIGKRVPLHLWWEQGAPVVGAEVAIFRDGFADHLLWQGASDDDGMVYVPAQYQDFLALVRAKDFGSLIDLVPEPDFGNTEWILEPLAKDWKRPPDQTTLVVVDQEKRPIAGAEVVLEIQGFWLRSQPLAWLTGNPSAAAVRTRGSGELVLANLPLSKMLILATPQSFESGELESLARQATQLDYPLPPLVVVPATPK